MIGYPICCIDSTKSLEVYVVHDDLMLDTGIIWAYKNLIRRSEPYSSDPWERGEFRQGLDIAMSSEGVTVTGAEEQHMSILCQF